MSDTSEEQDRLSGFLIVFGAVLSLIHGVLYILNFGTLLGFLPTFNLGYMLGSLTGIGIGILLIFLSLLSMAFYSSLISLRNSRNKKWTTYLLLGLLMYFLGGTLGGLLEIMGAILKRIL